MQEALNNVVKHASARRAVVRMAVVAGGAKLIVTIHDDGKGFDPAIAHPGHMGLETMAARAKELGGDYALLTAPGDGTTVRVTAPLDHAAEGQRYAALPERPLLSRQSS